MNAPLPSATRRAPTIALALALSLLAAPPRPTAAAEPPLSSATASVTHTNAPLEINSTLLDALLDEARTNHPGLRAAEQRQRAAEHGVDAVRTWPDPMFRFGGVLAGDHGPDLDMEGDLLYEVEQGLPLFGKAAAARREATASAAVASSATTYQSQLVRRSIVQAIHLLALADETLRIGTEDLALLDRMTGFARERQRAGLDATLDLLRLQNETEKRRQQLETERLQRDFERTSLNRLLARPQDAEWPALRLPAIAPAIPLSDQLFAMGTRFEPRLQVMRKELEMAEATTDVTRRSRRPDVNLGVEGRQWSGSGDFREGMVTVSLNLPWFNRRHYRADLDRDQARAAAVKADADDYELDVRRELFRVWTRVDAARREALLYRDRILPRSQLAADTTLAAWAAGRGMFLDVQEARRMLVEARLMYARALNEQHQMIAELVTCCGVAELDSLLMLGAQP